MILPRFLPSSSHRSHFDDSRRSPSLFIVYHQFVISQQKRTAIPPVAHGKFQAIPWHAAQTCSA
jgi:hypothetical protein